MEQERVGKGRTIDYGIGLAVYLHGDLEIPGPLKTAC